MNTETIAFVGGRAYLPSVQVRCVDVAKYLSCDYFINITSSDQIPDKYDKFVCVKPDLNGREIDKLCNRGRVIWDIIDFLPPESNSIHSYLCSTRASLNHIPRYKNIVVIPHHHCNLSGVPGFPKTRQPEWIGHPRWCPTIPDLEFKKHFSLGMTSIDVARLHRMIGIGLNIRACTQGYDFHRKINSGIKLINCIGFGIPSISDREPPYLEIGPDCTLFAEVSSRATAIQRLQNDYILYNELRENCLQLSGAYSLHAIACKYRELISSM